MFIAGMTGIAEPPVNDLWTIPGEEKMLAEWVRQDTETFNNCDPSVKYMQYQIEDYLDGLRKNREPLLQVMQVAGLSSFSLQYTVPAVTTSQ